MTLLQHELTDFKVNAFQNNEFHEVTKDDTTRNPCAQMAVAPITTMREYSLIWQSAVR